MIHPTLLWVLLSTLTFPARTQDLSVARQPPAGRQLSDLPPNGDVTVRTLLSRDAVHPRDTVLAAVILTIQEGWHINAGPAADADMIPTQVDSASVGGVTLFDPRYPAGTARQFAFAEIPIHVYEGSVTIFARVHVADTTSPGTYLLPVVVTCQACNDDICLPPSTHRMMLPVRVTTPEQPSNAVHENIFNGSRLSK